MVADSSQVGRSQVVSVYQGVVGGQTGTVQSSLQPSELVSELLVPRSQPSMGSTVASPQKSVSPAPTSQAPSQMLQEVVA
jgi:hypothetical protein